jgi:hypothetical protein
MIPGLGRLPHEDNVGWEYKSGPATYMARSPIYFEEPF